MAVKNRDWAFVTGAAVGAGAMFLLDPDRGRRRRALVRDKTRRAARKTRDAIDARSRDVANRTLGAAAEVRSRIAGERAERVGDEVIVQRVRAALGRLVSHPRAIEVVAHDGRVRLSGPVLAEDVDELLTVVPSIRGVTGFDNQLEVHDSPGNTPALQALNPRQPLFSDEWGLGTKVVVGLVGAAAVGLTMARVSSRSQPPRMS
jgi:gas vesicle protein